MSAYWLTFKPLGPTAPAGWPIENLRDLVTRFEADPSGTTEWWRIAAHQSARVGDRVYLFNPTFLPLRIRQPECPRKLRASTAALDLWC